jgi:hypothetical protein
MPWQSLRSIVCSLPHPTHYSQVLTSSAAELDQTSCPLKRVLTPTEDERKAARFFGYVESTRYLTLRLRCYLPPKISTFIDASFAVHPNMRSYSGVCATMGVGAFYSKSTAQKLNTTSSCHSEAVALAKCLQQSLFSQYVIEGQGYPTTRITIFQDNQSTIKLMENGRPTSEL